MPPSSGVATSATVPTRVVAYGRGEERDGMRPLAVEMPVNVIYGDVPYAVMMTTPADLEDFAYGFSLTEGIVARADEIRGAAVEDGEGGLRLVVDLAPGRLREHLARKRALSGRTGCGVCGIDDLKDIPRAERRAADGVTVRCPRSNGRSRPSTTSRCSGARPGRSMPPPGPTGTAPSWRCARMSGATTPSTS